ncbi:ATP-binding protein [Phaeobacter sp. B1627]|uniref:ATP-binding protein n=1 Tax=Phaeobacter sp. B1627 TaxID=2583809 RepID=UPI001118C321|nr:GAF domain-containing hybrid sensor histidine kinase/response regulator [Phaeobacter sp. B1627]TNJ48207.1 response regulator [Phaeobacter sp. B1627]
MNHSVTLRPDAIDILIRKLGLLDADPDPVFDTLSGLSAEVLQAPTVVLAFAARSDDGIAVKSAVGTAGREADLLQMALVRIFFAHILATDDAVRIGRIHPSALLPTLFTAQSGSGSDTDTDADAATSLSGLGVPVHLADGTPIGALCVLDSGPRDWSDGDLQRLQQIATCVDQRIGCRLALHQARTAEAQARQDAEARKSWLANMSHEIRTPLNGIIGSVDLLMQGAAQPATPPQDQTELLRAVNRSAQNLYRLLNDALDIAKIDAGKLELIPAPFDLRDMVHDVAKLFSANAAAKNVDLNLRFVDVPVGEMRLGDSFRLAQVLGNLLSNAVKFTDAGSVTLCLRGSPQGLQIQIRDSGCGIAPDAMEHLFKPFVQADAITARDKGGTGLGMAIVQQIVELMNGRIRAESSYGEGTTVHLTLPMPITEPQKPRAAAPVSRSDSLPQLLRGKRVLVADDSAANRMVLTKMLEHLGAIVDTARDGGDAYGRAVATCYDVLMLDIQMPVLSGTEVLKQLQDLFRTGRSGAETADNALCLAVTGNAFAEQTREYREAGFDGCLAKPLRQSDLLRVLTPLLSPRR